MNHLVYFTFGEQQGSVYATQVKQLLNYWSKKEDWKVTLIQIADEKNFKDLELPIARIFIKRKFKLLLSYHMNTYTDKIKSELSLNDKDTFYFSSRGTSAFLIASNFNKICGLNVKCNNLDVRGTIEELKLSKTRRFLYPFIKYRLKSVLMKATSVTVVTSSLKKHLLEDYNVNNPNLKINVNPTLSILKNSHDTNKKDIAYIGKIAWIDPSLFVEQILKINKLFLSQGWNISIIGNSSGSFGLENYGLKIVDRMPPQELAEYITHYHSGIVLRDSSIINKVAAPCKISDYLCLGMPIIYSGEIGSLKDFKDLYPECSKYLVHIDELVNEQRILDHIKINQEELKFLSDKAQAYFGVNAVIERYIETFNS